MPRFFYNPAVDYCMPFTYGGCGGNKNNFQTADDCMGVCDGLATDGYLWKGR